MVQAEESNTANCAGEVVMWTAGMAADMLVDMADKVLAVLPYHHVPGRTWVLHEHSIPQDQVPGLLRSTGTDEMLAAGCCCGMRRQVPFLVAEQHL